MKHRELRHSGALALVGLLLAGSAHAFNFGNMMNPSRWMNDRDNDYYDDDDYYRGGRYGPPPGYYGAPGYAPGYGVPGYGVPAYGVPGYGVPGYGAPAYGAVNAAPQQPAPGYGPDHDMPETDANYEYNRDQEEISRLKERIRKLEQVGQPAYGSQAAPPQPAPPQPAQSGWGNVPAYQPSQSAPKLSQPGWGGSSSSQGSQFAAPVNEAGGSDRPRYRYRGD